MLASTLPSPTWVLPGGSRTRSPMLTYWTSTVIPATPWLTTAPQLRRSWSSVTVVLILFLLLKDVWSYHVNFVCLSLIYWKMLFFGTKNNCTTLGRLPKAKTGETYCAHVVLFFCSKGGHGGDRSWHRRHHHWHCPQAQREVPKCQGWGGCLVICFSHILLVCFNLS